jgi:hypothetical protein
MATTIYATFTTEHDAERAAGALMDHGVNAADISFIIPEALQPAHTAYHGANIPTGPDSSTPYNAPASQHGTLQHETSGLSDIPVTDPGVSAMPVLSPISGYSNSPNHTPPGIAPGPGTRYDARGEVVTDPIPVNPPSAYGATLVTPVATLPSTTVESVPAHASRLPTLAGNTTMDVVEANHGPHIVDNTREQAHSARGISTTTARDAAKGAAEGAGLGVGLGLLIGLATVAIPGIGLVAGAGALVASLMAASAAAGAVAGGAYGFLNDMGLPPEMVHHLQNHLQSGGPILSIGVTPAVPETEIILLLEKYSATSAQAF